MAPSTSHSASGATYLRFESKRELLLAAVLHQAQLDVVARRFEDRSVTEGLLEATQVDGPLDVVEAMRLETYIAARREPEVAAELASMREKTRTSLIEPLVQRGIAEGEASPDDDFESFVYFMQALHLGRLVQRGAGSSPPNKDA